MMPEPSREATGMPPLKLVDDLTLDLANYQIVRGEQAIDLTALEQRLLTVFVSQAGRT